MCAAATPCLDDSGRCTSKCVPLAASFCAGVCANALQYVPSNGPGAQQGASSHAQQPLGGSALLQALGAQPGPSEVGVACFTWHLQLPVSDVAYRAAKDCAHTCIAA